MKKKTVTVLSCVNAFRQHPPHADRKFVFFSFSVHRMCLNFRDRRTELKKGLPTLSLGLGLVKRNLGSTFWVTIVSSRWILNLALAGVYLLEPFYLKQGFAILIFLICLQKTFCKARFGNRLWATKKNVFFYSSNNCFPLFQVSIEFISPQRYVITIKSIVISTYSKLPIRMSKMVPEW